MKTLTASILTLLTSVTACAWTPAQAQTPTSERSLDARESEQSWRARRIEGLWDEQVTIKDCSSGATLMVSRGTNLFSSGGALVAVNSAPASALGTALGQWWYESRGRSFGAKMRLNRYNPDGSFAGIREIEREIMLDNRGDTLAGAISARDFDAAGNVIRTICGSEDGRRVASP